VYEDEIEGWYRKKHNQKKFSKPFHETTRVLRELHYIEKVGQNPTVYMIDDFNEVICALRSHPDKHNCNVRLLKFHGY
jgi:hypothetical protein